MIPIQKLGHGVVSDAGNSICLETLVFNRKVLISRANVVVN